MAVGIARMGSHDEMKSAVSLRILSESVPVGSELSLGVDIYHACCSQ